LLFTVKDTGIGIPEDKLELIFDSFTQAERSTTRHFGGTGLGLSICNKLVAMMNGKINVKSQYGVGSDFYFTARFNKSIKNKDEYDQVPEKIHGLNVIAVDDNKTNRFILSEHLKSFGFKCETYESTLEVQKLFSNNKDGKYDLIITNYKMPDLNGFELIEAIREKNKIPAVILTTLGSWGEKKQFKDLGNITYLSKPVKQSALLDSIIELMGISDGKSTPNKIRELGINISDLKALPDSTQILLAEDNMINQRVTSALVKKTGIHLDVVGDGLEALEAIKKNSYDLVLMDVQMPNMDGLKATKEIRDTLNRKDLPIIALTANVMKGDKEKCIAAGMNDFLGKPIKPTDLYSILIHWIKK